MPQPFRGSTRSRSGIIQLMRQPGRQFSQRHELVALLVGATHLANPIRQHVHQPSCQLRDSLHHLRKAILVKAGHPRLPQRPDRNRKNRQSRKRQHAGYLSGTHDINRRVRPVAVSPSSQFTFEQHHQHVRRVSLVNHDVARHPSHIFAVRSKPSKLLFTEIGKDRDLAQRQLEGLAPATACRSCRFVIGHQETLLRYW